MDWFHAKDMILCGLITLLGYIIKWYLDAASTKQDLILKEIKELRIVVEDERIKTSINVIKIDLNESRIERLEDRIA